MVEISPSGATCIIGAGGITGPTGPIGPAMAENKMLFYCQFILWFNILVNNVSVILEQSHRFLDSNQYYGE